MHRITLIALVILIASLAYSQDLIEQREMVELNINYDITDPPDLYCVQPFLMSFEDENELKITVIYYDLLYNTELMVYLYYNTQNGEIMINNDIDHDTNTIFPNPSNSPIEIIDGEPAIEVQYPVEDIFGEDGRYFEYALLSPDEQKMATVFIFLESSEKKERIDYYVKDDESELYMYSTEFSQYINAVELKFSPSSNFFYNRGIRDDDIYDFVSDWEFRTALSTHLMDLNTDLRVEANADVAFTSDERYFVTERDEVPTLVDTETDENLLIYDIPVRMVGATFSSDDQTLYLTGLDNNLYIFDSNLPTQVDDWMLR